MKIAHLLAGAAALALTAGAANAQNVSTITQQVSGSASQGAASDSSGATFNLSATVAEDCSFYTGGGDVDVDFGTLGIYNTSAQGLANAFRMTGDATATVVTSVAGCNTANSVEVVKSGRALGMRTDNASGFDTNTFQANLPYRVTASYTATDGMLTGAGVPRRVRVNTGEGRDAQRQGAFKSPMTLEFYVPAAQKALVAGEYTDSVEVTLSAL